MKTLVKTTLAASIALALTACHNDKKDPVEPPIEPTTLEISGGAVKGTLIGATAMLFSADDLTTQIGDSVQTGADGSYTLTVTDEAGLQIAGAYVVKVMADEDTTMICDAIDCNGVAKGETVPATALTGLSLSSFTFADSAVTDAPAVNVNSLSTMATDAVISAASVEGSAIDLSNLTQESATALQVAGSEVVGAIIGVDLSGVDLFALDIVDASVSADVPSADANAATLTLVNASLSNIAVAADSTMGAALTSYLMTVEEITTAIFVNPDVDLGADFSDQMDSINLVQAEVAADSALILTEVELDTGTTIPVEEIPAAVDPEDITDIIGDIIDGTGGTGGTGGEG